MKNPDNIPDTVPDKKNIEPVQFKIKEHTLYLKGELTLDNAQSSAGKIRTGLSSYDKKNLEVDIDGLEHLDSIGVATLGYIRSELEDRNIKTTFKHGKEHIRKKLDTFSVEASLEVSKKKKTPFFEYIGEGFEKFFSENVTGFIVLMANVTYWSVTDIFKSGKQRKGEFYNQAVQIGVNAVWIVAAMAFIIGLVLALQSAAQLRNFGANVYIVDLTVIAMMSEMGPLITAIIVAGRSGSSIAAEIATMKVTSELDALKTMAINPVRYVVIPKMHGSVVTLPFLTILANFMGILGGMLIAFLDLDITPQVFFNRMTESLYNRDILIGIFKSLVFAGIIVLTGSFLGMKADKGAEGVGRVTTLAVVVAISLVIVADSIMGLIFY